LSSESTIQDTKQQLRKKLLPKRKSISERECAERSTLVCHRVMELAEFSAASFLACYMACQGEVELTEVMKNCKLAGKKLLLPRFNATTKSYEMVAVNDPETDTEPGYYGIAEPQESFAAVSPETARSQKVVWLVPGVAFDTEGNRLGRGAGWYDNLLEKTRGTRIGVCWDWQLVNKVPADETDIKMNIVVSDQRLIRCFTREKPAATVS